MRKLIAAAIACIAAGVAVSAWFLPGSAEQSPIVQPASALPAENSAQAVPEFDLDPIPRPTCLEMPTNGYSGTMQARADEQSSPALKPKARATIRLPDWAHYAADDQVEAVAAQLPCARDYTDTLVRMWQMNGPNSRLTKDDQGRDIWKDCSRFLEQPARLGSLLLKAAEAARGVARQSLIFQVAIAVPPDTAFPWLRRVANEGDSEDYQDAMCALAFSGDHVAVGWFQGLPVASFNCRRLVDDEKQHDALARAGERDFLRSYRCIETLDCRPYFHAHSFAFNLGPVARFPWAVASDAQREENAELVKSLLPAWIRHFEGHPGSDDMAFRLCRIYEGEGNLLEAARWASRCSTLPDQDMLRPGTRELLKLAELSLDDRELELLNDWPDREINRNLLNYIRVRRTAGRDGFSVALDELGRLATLDPELQISAAYGSRWGAPVPKGLDSGVEPLAADDALRRLTANVAHTPRFNAAQCFHHGFWREGDERLHPPAECIAMDQAELAEQFRVWDTEAELQRRLDETGAGHADLQYKLAAVLYHQPTALFPAYAQITWWYSGIPYDVGSNTVWCRQAYSLQRASLLFEQLANEHPGYEARDKALFSAGMAQMKLANCRAYCSEERPRREGIRLFLRCADEHPDSTLADDCRRVIKYWHDYYGY